MAYFHARDGSASGPSTHEIYDCFDYLQQAITCLADTYPEHHRGSEPDRLGFSGYGNHQCRDSAGAFVFAERWRVWNGKTIEERTNITEEQNISGRVIRYDSVS